MLRRPCSWTRGASGVDSVAAVSGWATQREDSRAVRQASGVGQSRGASTRRCGSAGSKPAWPAETASETRARSEEHTSELQSLMRISYAVFCLKKKKKTDKH